MHAVVGRSTVQDFEQARKYLRDEGIPRFSQAPGFKGGYWVRLDGDNGASLLLFETEEGARAAAEMLRSNPPPMVSPISIDVGEVVEQV